MLLFQEMGKVGHTDIQAFGEQRAGHSHIRALRVLRPGIYHHEKQAAKYRL